MPTISVSGSPKSSSKAHAPILAGAKFKGTPAYEVALKRLVALGLSIEEATSLLG